MRVKYGRVNPAPSALCNFMLGFIEASDFSGADAGIDEEVQTFMEGGRG